MDSAAPSGYLSEDAKKRFTILTGILVDSALTGLPAAIPFWWMFRDFESLIERGPAFPVWFFALMGAAMVWGLAVVLGFSYSEGRWGVTPGKWLTSIRVIGTDLTPCGFGRALVRNLLKFVDGFFNFLVGILMVAYTPEWQRLGDLAARTIVVRMPVPTSRR